MVIRGMPVLLGRELRWLVRQSRPYLRLQAASVVLISCSSWFYLLDPLVMKWLLDHVLPRRSWRGLIVALAAIFACYLGRVLLNAAASLFTTEASQKTILDLRRRLLAHLDIQAADYHETEPVGARFYLFKEPMDEIGQLSADLLPAVLRTAVLTVSVLITMFFLSARLTVAILPLVPVFLVIRAHYRRQLQRRADDVQQQQSAVSTFLEEHLRGIIQVQLLTAEKLQERRGFHQFALSVRAQCNVMRTAAQFTIAYNAIIVAGTITVLGLGGKEFFHGRLTIGGLVAFYTYLARLFEPLSSAGELYSRLQRADASIHKVMAALGLQPSLKELPNPVTLGLGSPGDIEFEGVYFAYTDNRQVLWDLNFRIPAASRIAFVGANGSGKSTIGRLMVRLYDPTAGVVRLNGLDIRQIDLLSLRTSICYLPQDAVLFTGTLRDNLLFGNPSATEAELALAVDLAELQPVLSVLPGGLSASLGPSGLQLSSGERQRIAIARGVLRHPRLMILDEATSFIDGKAEHRILSRLTEFLKTTTLIVISHHLSALYWAQEIFVMDRGTLVERGPHAALSATNGLYAQLFSRRSQTNLMATNDWEGEITYATFAIRNNSTDISPPHPIFDTGEGNTLQK
jgi:ABC-type multidrug transport system fused ATPase/permease subunit